MFGFISKRAHDAAIAVMADNHKAEIEALTATHEAEIKVLSDARDHLVTALNSAEVQIRNLNGFLDNSRARAARLEIDNRILGKQVADIDGQIAENARFIRVGKARVAALAKQNERAKAKRRAGA